MALRIKADGSGSAEPKLRDSVNDPLDFSIPGWNVATDYVEPAGMNSDGTGYVNSASVGAGYPVWDGQALHTSRGRMSLQAFFKLNNVPEADQEYYRRELDRAYNSAIAASPDLDVAAVNCRPWWNDRCVCVKRGSIALPVKGQTLRLRVRPSFKGVGFTLPDIPPSIEVEVALMDKRHDYMNVLSIAVERPSQWGSNEQGQLVSDVPGAGVWYWAPWPEPLERAFVIGEFKLNGGSPPSAMDGVSYLLPLDERTSVGHTFAGRTDLYWASTGVPGPIPELQRVEMNKDDIASLDPTHGVLIPPPKPGNPWRPGLYYKGDKLVMAKSNDAHGQGDAVAPDGTQGCAVVGEMTIYTADFPDDLGPSYPNAIVTYPDAELGEHAVADRIPHGSAHNPPPNRTLRKLAYFYENTGITVPEQSPKVKMICTAESGNGRVSAASYGTAAVAVCYSGSSVAEVTINGAAPKENVSVIVSPGGEVLRILVPLEGYWTKNGNGAWAAGQKLEIVATWRMAYSAQFHANCGWGDVIDPAFIDEDKVDFDRFEQWEFGTPD